LGNLEFLQFEKFGIFCQSRKSAFFVFWKKTFAKKVKSLYK